MRQVKLRKSDEPKLIYESHKSQFIKLREIYSSFDATSCCLDSTCFEVYQEMLTSHREALTEGAFDWKQI